LYALDDVIAMKQEELEKFQVWMNTHASDGGAIVRGSRRAAFHVPALNMLTLNTSEV